MKTKVQRVNSEFLKQRLLFEAEIVSSLPLRFALISLRAICDQNNRFVWRPIPLKIEIMPYDDVDMEAILETLLSYGFIQKVQEEGEWFGCITPF